MKPWQIYFIIFICLSFLQLGQHMKLNLRYDLLTLSDRPPPSSLSMSSESAATLSADDQLAASTDLWRDRSGSTSSARSVIVISAAERRQSFAKSYSFGDLGPTQSADSDDVKKTKWGTIFCNFCCDAVWPNISFINDDWKPNVMNNSLLITHSWDIYLLIPTNLYNNSIDLVSLRVNMPFLVRKKLRKNMFSGVNLESWWANMLTNLMVSND